MAQYATIKINCADQTKLAGIEACAPSAMNPAPQASAKAATCAAPNNAPALKTGPGLCRQSRTVSAIAASARRPSATTKTAETDSNQFSTTQAIDIQNKSRMKSRKASAAGMCVDAQNELAISMAPTALAQAAKVSAVRRKFKPKRDRRALLSFAARVRPN